MDNNHRVLSNTGAILQEEKSRPKAAGTVSLDNSESSVIEGEDQRALHPGVETSLNCVENSSRFGSNGAQMDSQTSVTDGEHTRGGVPGTGTSPLQEEKSKSNSGAEATVEERLEDIRKEVKVDDRQVDAYREIEALWRIQQSPLHKLALAEWQRKELELNYRATQRALRSQDLHTQLHNIIGWYAVFQGVVLTAVSQLNQNAQGKDLCGKTWFPVVLTGLGTVVTIVAVWRLFLDLLQLEKTINSEKKAKQEAVSRYNKLIRKGVKDFSFRKHAKNNQEFPDPTFKLEWGFVIVLLLVFSGVFILSYFVILCDTWMATNWKRTAGILRILNHLPDKKAYNIKVDANATYREYWCAATHDDPNAVVLSSDDCQEYKEVIIKFDGVNTYTWEGVRRDNGKRDAVKNEAEVAHPEGSENAPNKGYWRRLTDAIFKQG